MLAAYEEMKTQEVFSSSNKQQPASLPLSSLPGPLSSAASPLPPSSSSVAQDKADKYRLLACDGRPQRESLVQYDAAQPVNRPHQPSAPLAAAAGGKRKTEAGRGAVGESRKSAAQLSEVLNAILPPLDCGVDAASGVRLVRRVSLDASSREQVIALQRRLDEQLQERQARESGICPVREELYAQCFDELIRQVTISSPERGLLLLRLRDELRLSIAAYQSLYAASITFGQRKAQQAEMGREELSIRLQHTDDERLSINRQIVQLKAVYEQMDRRLNEQRAADEKRQQDEKDFLKYQAQHLEAFLKSAQQ